MTNSFTDMLADISICSRDIPYFQKLGLNTLMIFNIDIALSHSDCMHKLQQAGMYVIVMLNGRERKGPFNFNGTWARNWDYDFYKHFEEVIDEFQQYPNTLAFTFGTYDGRILMNAKGAALHMREYTQAHKYRAIPIGIRNTVRKSQ